MSVLGGDILSCCTRVTVPGIVEFLVDLVEPVSKAVPLIIIIVIVEEYLRYAIADPA